MILVLGLGLGLTDVSGVVEHIILVLGLGPGLTDVSDVVVEPPIFKRGTAVQHYVP